MVRREISDGKYVRTNRGILLLPWEKSNDSKSRLRYPSVLRSTTEYPNKLPMHATRDVGLSQDLTIDTPDGNVGM